MQVSCGSRLLYLSLHFKQHRAEYYRQLDQVRQNGDWEAWLDFFLEGAMLTANAAVDTALRLLKLFREDEARLKSGKRSHQSMQKVFDAMRSRPISNIRQLTARTGLSFATVAKTVDALVSIGLLRELTGNRRGRVFAYQRYVEILNEGAEPL
jgi:Fic family protein